MEKEKLMTIRLDNPDDLHKKIRVARVMRPVPPMGAFHFDNKRAELLKQLKLSMLGGGEMEVGQFDRALQYILKWSRDYIMAYIPEFLNQVPLYALLDENDKPLPYTALFFVEDVQKMLTATHNEWKKLDKLEAKETGNPIDD